MEALKETKSSRTMSVTFPSSDYSLFRSMTTRMGWTIIPQSRKRKAEVRYPALDRAIVDVKAGRVTTYSSAEEMFK